MTTTARKRKFRDQEYRSSYVDSFLDSLVATQIRVLRQQRHLKQGELADLAGMKQSRISTLEDVNYASWNIRTLKRLAAALDVALVVKFESFGGILGDLNRMSREELERPSFQDDPFFHETTRAEDHLGDFTVANADSGYEPVTVTGSRRETTADILVFERPHGESDIQRAQAVTTSDAQELLQREA